MALKVVLAAQFVVFLLIVIVLMIVESIRPYAPSLPDYANGIITFTMYDNNALQWDEAQQACQFLHNGSLARIDHAEINDKLVEYETGVWDGMDVKDSWIGLVWRPQSATDIEQLLWADNCDRIDLNRYHYFKSGDDIFDASELCYRRKAGTEWERRQGSEQNNFICQHVQYPHSKTYTSDDTSGMVVITKLATETCKNICDRMYGCFKFSVAGDSACIVDVNTGSTHAGLSSWNKEVKYQGVAGSLRDEDYSIITDVVKDLPTPISEAVCSPDQSQVPGGAKSVQISLVLVNTTEESRLWRSDMQFCGLTMVTDFSTASNIGFETCSTVTLIESSVVYETVTHTPATSTLTMTTTIVDLVTQTPEVIIVMTTTTIVDEVTLTPVIVPTTIIDTEYVTMTTQIESSCSPLLELSSTSCSAVIISASTLTEISTVFETVTQSPEVSIVPTTVMYTDTVVMTTQVAQSCSSQIITEATTVTYTASADASSACTTSTVVVNRTQEEIEEAVSSIVSELTIDAKSTSKSRSRLVSAQDTRVSSQTMGVFAIGLISVICISIVLLDAPTVAMTCKTDCMT